jgi:transcriptional regulator NrdR family protein
MSDTLQPDDKSEATGIECPRCGCGHLEQVWTRRRNKMIVRRRDCRNCGKNIMTYEQSALLKKD